MIRAVLDSNVLISTLIRTKGKPARILPRASSQFEWLTSEYILKEVVAVLQRRNIQTKYASQVNAKLQSRYLSLIRSTAIMTHVQEKTKNRLRGILVDPKDEEVLAAAIEGGANYLVTGDQHLLELRKFQGIRIVTPVEFLSVLARKAKWLTEKFRF